MCDFRHFFFLLFLLFLRLLCRWSSVNQHRCSKFPFLSFLSFSFSSSFLRLTPAASPSFTHRYHFLLLPSSFASLPRSLPTHTRLLLAPPLDRLPPQYLSALAHCSASSRPPPCWRRSTSRGRGARTRCRPATGSTLCRGRRTGRRCFTSTPPGTTTGRTGPPPPTSEWGGRVDGEVGSRERGSKRRTRFHSQGKANGRQDDNRKVLC